MMRRAVLVGVAFGILALVGMVGAAREKVPDEIRAKRFTVLDQSGVPALRLSVDRAGTPTITLANKAVSGDIALKVSPDGVPSLELLDGVVAVAPTGLRVADASGAPRATLDTSGDGLTALSLLARDSRPTARLLVTPEGSAALEVFDKQGTRTIAVGETDGVLKITLTGVRSNAEIAVLPDGGSSLTLDQYGKSRASFTVSPDGPSRFSMNDRNGRSRASITVQPGGAIEILPAPRVRPSEP